MEAARRANDLKFTEFRLNCDGGSVGACTSLGEWFELMRGDTAAAVELYRPACFERRYQQACYNLGNALGEERRAWRGTAFTRAICNSCTEPRHPAPFFHLL